MADRSYDVVHFAYCGMAVPLLEDVDYQTARDRFKRRVEYFRRRIGGAVVYRGRSEAELCEPEQCMMVPDDCGTLKIVQHGRWSA
jgi:hypothetical protein